MINGKTFKDVVKITITHGSEEWTSETYGSLSIALTRTVDQISTTTGNIRVTGDVKQTAKSMSGNVHIGGNCGSASSMSGNVAVGGNLKGKASSMSGNVYG